MLTQHSSIFQIISWNLIWKSLINHKVYAQKVFWHVILHNHLCSTLYMFFIKLKVTNVFPKHILKLKAHDQSSQPRKKLFCWLIVNDYFCNNLCKFLIKTKSMYRWREGQNQWRKTPATFTILRYDCQKQPPDVFYEKAVLSHHVIFTENTSVGVSF